MVTLSEQLEPKETAVLDSNPLRVVLASSQRGWHGGEGQARLLAVGLRERGHEVHLFARRGETFAQRMAKEGFPVVELSGGGRSLRGILQARLAIRRLKPDVLHANDSHALTCLMLAGLGLRVPAHIASRRVIYPIRTPVQFRLFADRIVCVATATVEACRAASLPEERLALVFSGVDPSRIETGDQQQIRHQVREKLGLASDTLLLLCVGKLNEAKGHCDLLDAMPDILQKHPHLTLVLAGAGELQETLQTQAKRLGIAQNVRFLGYRDDVPDLVRAADLYVQPSRSEGLCNAVIDAMFARCPVVASARGGLLDLIPPEEGSAQTVSGTLCWDGPRGASFMKPFMVETPFISKYGWLTPPKDPQRLAATILDVLDTPKKQRHARAKLARTRAMKNFTADRMVQGMLQVYRDAIAHD